MYMLNPTFSRWKPTDDDLRSLWEAFTLQVIRGEDSPLVRYVEALERSYAKVKLGCLQASENPTLDYFVLRNDLASIDFFSNILAMQARIFGLPDADRLKIPNTFRQTDGFVLEGELAHLLFTGGAYRFGYSAKDSMILARDFCNSMFMERYDEVIAWTTDIAWSDWFVDVVWDHTWIIVDKRTRSFWTLIVTDTD